MRKILRGHCFLYLFLLVGCFEYHPYEANIGEAYGNSNVNNINTVKSLLTPNDTIRFAWFGDTQRFYDATADFVSDVNSKGNIDFVLHGGDITDFGMKLEYYWMEDIFDGLNMPHICLVGNHDLLGNGESIYRSIYGDPDFSFVFNRIKFICLNTNPIESSYPVPDYNFIAQNISDSISATYDYTIVAMHASPSGMFSIPVSQTATQFYNTLNPAKNLIFCLYAHNHSILERDVFNDGIMHFVTDCIKDRIYFLFTLINGEYSYTIENF